MVESFLELAEFGEVVFVKFRAGFDCDSDDPSVGGFKGSVDFDMMSG